MGVCHEQCGTRIETVSAGQAVPDVLNLIRFTGESPVGGLSGFYSLRIDFHVAIVLSEAALELPDLRQRRSTPQPGVAQRTPGTQDHPHAFGTLKGCDIALLSAIAPLQGAGIMLLPTIPRVRCATHGLRGRTALRFARQRNCRTCVSR
jgi:hypothetical protein